jgi:hypothetical protein
MVRDDFRPQDAQAAGLPKRVPAERRGLIFCNFAGTA